MPRVEIVRCGSLRDGDVVASLDRLLSIVQGACRRQGWVGVEGDAMAVDCEVDKDELSAIELDRGKLGRLELTEDMIVSSAPSDVKFCELCAGDVIACRC